jgi:hypothetical protein
MGACVPDLCVVWVWVCGCICIWGLRSSRACKSACRLEAVGAFVEHDFTTERDARRDVPLIKLRHRICGIKHAAVTKFPSRPAWNLQGAGQPSGLRLHLATQDKLEDVLPGLGLELFQFCP